MGRFKKGQKVFHAYSGRWVEVVEDNGGEKVKIRIDGIELHTLRKNLKTSAEIGALPQEEPQGESGSYV